MPAVIGHGVGDGGARLHSAEKVVVRIVGDALGMPPVRTRHVERARGMAVSHVHHAEQVAVVVVRHGQSQGDGIALSYT